MKRALLLIGAVLCFSALGARDIKLANPRMNGDDVTRLQTRLHALGYEEAGEIDGWYGPMSEGAVKHFQEDFFLESDGIVTVKLWELMFHADCLSLKEALAASKRAESRASLLDMTGEYNTSIPSLGEMAAFYVTLWEADGELIKGSFRLVGDGSGYEYHCLYNEAGSLVRLEIIWWVYDFEAGEERQVYEEFCYLSGGTPVASRYRDEAGWHFSDEEKAAEVNQILGWIEEALAVR